MISILLDDKNYKHVFAILEYDESNLLNNNTSNSQNNTEKTSDVLENPDTIKPEDQLEMKPMNSYRKFCEQSNHVMLPNMEQHLANFIKMRFRFIF